MRSWIPDDLRDKTRSNIAVVCTAILLLAVIYYFGRIWGFVQALVSALQPFLIGVAIAFILLPFVGKLEWVFKKLFFKKKPHPRLSRVVSTILAFSVLLALISGFFAILLPQLIVSVKSIIQYISGFIQKNSDAINQFLLKYEFLSIEGEKLVIAWEKIASRIMGYTDVLRDTIMAIAGSISNGIYSVVFHILVGLIAAFYLMLDKEAFSAQAKKLCYAFLKKPTCELLIYWTRRANQIFVGFITGKILDSLVIGVICYLCMLLFRIEFPLLISVIVGITNIIPFFGPLIGAIPSILILLLVNPLSALWFGVFILILQQIDGNVIGPFILGDYVGLSAFWVMLSIVVGSSLFGFMGMLLSVPVFALIYAIIRTVAATQLEKRHLPSDSAFYREAPENLREENKDENTPA